MTVRDVIIKINEAKKCLEFVEKASTEIGEQEAMRIKDVIFDQIDMLNKLEVKDYD